MGKMPNYIFKGYITEVKGNWCWMTMRDQTVPSYPDEQWCVGLAKFPSTPSVGQYVTFTITESRGFFTLDTSVWTAAQLKRAEKRALQFRKIFSEPIEEPPSADAVDPVLSNSHEPSTREKESYD